MNKESLKEYLNSRYQGWSSFLNNVIFLSSTYKCNFLGADNKQ